jgi:hypothetical protein
MVCIEIQSNKYQTRKSPPFHAKDCKDLIKKGKDGDYVSRSDIKGIYKWSKIAGKPVARNTRKKVNGKAYQIHDNGNKPFQVVVSGKTVEIYKGKRVAGDDYDENRNYNQLIQKLGVKDIYLGESLCGVSRISDFNCGPDTIGNSVLLHVDENNFMFIGKEIYEFTIEDEIEAYYSTIGLDDIPSPILLGTTYVYFMSDHTYVSRDLFKAPMNKKEWADASAYYYGLKNLKTGEKTYKMNKIPKKHILKMKGLKMIHKAHRG